MAEAVNTETKNTTTTVKTATKAANELTFSKQQFIDNAEKLGYSSIAVAGALYDCEKEKITKTEFKELVKKFLMKEVK